MVDSADSVSQGYATSMRKKSFLFLQGVCSPFFAHLADLLLEEGHRITRVCFTGGDWLYWTPRRALHYRGGLAGLPAYMAEVLRRYDVSDLVVFGDQRPVHRPAIALAQQHGVAVHVFEEGYFRPFWVTLERGGVNAHSTLPRNPAWYLEVASTLPAQPAPVCFRSPFRVRAFHDVAYHVGGLVNPLLYPGYRTHAPVTAPVEYAGYMTRFLRLPLWRRSDARQIDELLQRRQPFFLLPLQLNGDAQIREHSRFESMQTVIHRVMRSFSLHAPSNAVLVIKNHPLDMGLTPYRRYISTLVHRFGLLGRVLYLESGDLQRLLDGAAGTVMVNSTVGAVALERGCPTLALSDPIYNLPGLTFQGPLDSFWRDAAPPDPELVRAFRTVVIHGTQINGGFYCRTGIKLCAANALPVLTAEKSPLEAMG